MKGFLFYRVGMDKESVMKRISKIKILREMLKQHTRICLLDEAYALELPGVSKLDIEELADRIADKLFDHETFYYRMAIFDKDAITIFEKGLEEPYAFTPEERDIVCTFKERELGWNDKEEFWGFLDVAEVWKTLDRERFDIYSERASWVWKCQY